VTVYSDAYKSFAQVKKMDGLPIQAPRQVYREFLNVTIHQEDSERSSTSSGILLRKRIELNLVHSENITNPNDQMLQWYPKGDDYFLPPLDTSQFWVLKPNFVDKANLKPEDTSINVTVVFELITPNSFMFTLGMRQNADSNPVFKTMGEQMKELLVNNSPEYLIFMVCATILHTIFQSLAMKNGRDLLNRLPVLEQCQELRGSVTLNHLVGCLRQCPSDTLLQRYQVRGNALVLRVDRSCHERLSSLQSSLPGIVAKVPFRKIHDARELL